ncbi:A-kinase anchor protein 14 [Trichomycterus rosablanca]|uniref:A-kinase anchor protein 14 n=1 Tax=Trichomycterus rosablanca TaxID=2290929 RepID=UPI002F354B4F
MAEMETTPKHCLDLNAPGFIGSELDDGQLSQNSEYKQPNFKISNIDWIACKDFTADEGKRQIEEYISTWGMDPDWMFSVKFLQESELEFELQYHYRTCWSIPTPRCPIPKHTASVYFIIRVSKVKPSSVPVLVQFQVESNRSVHVPGKTRFREKWLRDVIDNKTLLMDSVTF